MKGFKLILLLLITYTSQAQLKRTIIATPMNYTNVIIDTFAIKPSDTTGSKILGRIVLHPNGTLFRSDGSKFLAITGGVGTPEVTTGTIAQLRALTTGTGKVYTSTDRGGGSWVDEGLNDGAQSDDGVLYIITTNGHRLKRAFTGPIFFEWFGAKGDGTTDNTAAVNAAIDYANSLNPTIVDANNVNGINLQFGMGRFIISGTPHAIKRSGVNISGTGDNGTTVVTNNSGVTFDFGGTDGYIVGGGISNLKLERTGVAGASIAIQIQNAHRLTFKDILIVNMGTVFNLGTSPSRIASDITISNVRGYTYNGGEAFMNVNYGAGLYVDQTKVFVGGVLAPAVNRTDTMTTVRHTDGIVFTGWWDTFVMTNCQLQNFDYEILAIASNNIIQSFFVSNCVFDYARTTAVHLQGVGSGSVSATNFNNNWYASWEGDAISLQGSVLSCNILGGRIESAGMNGIYISGTSKEVVTSNVTINGANRNTGTFFGISVLGGSSHKITNNNISKAAGASFPWQNFAGVYLDPAADNVILTGNEWYGSYSGLYAPASSGTSRVVRNNIPNTDSLGAITDTSIVSTINNVNKQKDIILASVAGAGYLTGESDPSAIHKSGNDTITSGIKRFLGVTPIVLDGGFIHSKNSIYNTTGFLSGILGDTTGDYGIVNNADDVPVIKIGRTTNIAKFYNPVIGVAAVADTQFVILRQLKQRLTDSLNARYAATSFTLRNSYGIGDSLMTTTANSAVVKHLFLSGNATKDNVNSNDSTLAYIIGSNNITGTFTFTGDGTTTAFTKTLSITGLSSTSKVFIDASSAIGAPLDWVDKSTESITLHYLTAPTSGTKNVNYFIIP